MRRMCEFLRGDPDLACDRPAVTVFRLPEYECHYCAEHYDWMIEHHMEKRDVDYSWETLRLNGECR